MSEECNDSPEKKSQSPLFEDEIITCHIPKQNAAYAHVDYWDERFQKEDNYEWLCSYKDVACQIQPFLQTNSRILILGCGNSRFSEDLYNDGYIHITNVDYSEKVIHRMKLKHQDKSSMEWKES